MSDAPRPVVALSLEDDDLDAELVAERLRAGGLDVDLRRARNRSEYLEHLHTSPVDVILSDFSLPGYDGMAALDAARKVLPEVPFIFVSGAIGEERAIETLRRGAADYVLKDRLERLVPAVRRALDLADERQKRIAAESERDRLLLSERSAREMAESANRMKDEFLAVVSHELRTPLNAILGWAALLANAPPDAATLSKGLATIERNARVQARLIEDILDISRIVTGKLHVRDNEVLVSSFVQAAVDGVRPAACAKGVELLVDVPRDAGLVAGDADRLQQVVWNLVSNALKFTRKGGRIAVVVARKNEQVEIQVADTGTGIDPEFLPYVFDRFRQGDGSATRAHGGLGLGLAIVRHLVELHGGTVSADSAGAGQGSTFTVRLPARPLPAAELGDAGAAGPTVAAAAEDSLDVVRVLVVDDDRDSRELASFVLAASGAVVATASNVVEAFDRLGAFRPDVIVSDIGMPQVDGYSFARRLRALPPESGGRIPAVALTAYSRQLDRDEAEAAGFQQHLSKPVTAERLVAVVGALARPGGAAGSVA